MLGNKAKSFTAIIKDAETALKMSRRTAMTYLKRLTDSGLIVQSSGIYWAKDRQEGNEN